MTVSCAFGCPFEGEVDPGAVADLCERLADADELVLADTIGVATPRRVRRLVERVSILGRPVGFHGHNTRNTGYAAAWAALDGGATVLDASVGGLGGCPFSPDGDRQRRDRGPRLAARARRRRDRRRPGRARRDGALARGDARPRARRLRLPRRAVSPKVSAMNRLARRDEPVPAPARRQPGRLVPVGRGGVRARARRGQADLALDRLLGLPLVPRDGARVVRRSRDRRR